MNINTAENLYRLHGLLPLRERQETAGCAAHSLCRQMVFLKDLDATMEWQCLAPEARELYSIQEAVQLAADFFSPLLHDET